MAITYEQVAIAIESIVSEELTPSLTRIRERLGGTGSPNTIQKHKIKWQDAQPVVKKLARTLPQMLTDAILAEVDKQAEQEKIEVQKKLIEAVETIETLTSNGEDIDAKLLEKTTANELLLEEKILTDNKLSELKEEIEGLGEKLKNECDRSEGYGKALATAQAKTEIYEANLKESENRFKLLEEKLEKAKEVAITADKQEAVKAESLRAALEVSKALTIDKKALEGALATKEKRSAHLEALVESKVQAIDEKVDEIKNVRLTFEKEKAVIVKKYEITQSDLEKIIKDLTEKNNDLESKIKEFEIKV